MPVKQDSLLCDTQCPKCGSTNIHGFLSKPIIIQQVTHTPENGGQGHKIVNISGIKLQCSNFHTWIIDTHGNILVPPTDYGKGIDYDRIRKIVDDQIEANAYLYTDY